MAKLGIKTEDFERLIKAYKNIPDVADKSINEVLQNEASPIIVKSIQGLIPESNRNWAGKLPAAANSKSVAERKKDRKNLSITIGSTSKYHYLYFPDDGTNTRRHIGNQQFFLRGAEAKQSEIIDLCINRLVGDLEKSL